MWKNEQNTTICLVGENAKFCIFKLKKALKHEKKKKKKKKKNERQ